MEAESSDPTQIFSLSFPLKPKYLDFRSSKAFILVVIATAVFTDTFFYTLIIPILPDIVQERAGIPQQDAQKWVSILLSTYALANLVTSPIVGFIIDRNHQRKPALLGGLVAMVVSTTLFTFGRSPALLLTARALQGLSAAVIRVGGLALITDTFEAGKSGSAMGWQSVGMFLGTFTGPSISGVLYDRLGYSAVFGVAYFVLGVDIFLRLVMIERREAARWMSDEETSEEDEFSALISNSQISRLEEGLLQSGSDNQSSEGGTTSAVDSSSSRTAFPILILLKDRRLLTALWATFSCAVIMTALESVIPLYTMRLFSWTPTETGLLIVALSVSIVADPIIGALADKYGSRGLSVIGFTTVTVVYSLATLVVHDSRKDKIGLCLLLVVLGFAVGAISTPNMVEISSLTIAAEKRGALGSVRADQVIGQAFGALSVSYQLGSLLGPAWGGVILLTQGWATMSASFVALGGVSAFIMLSFAGE